MTLQTTITESQHQERLDAAGLIVLDAIIAWEKRIEAEVAVTEMVMA